MIRMFLLLLACAGVSACARNATGPRLGPDGFPEGLHVELRVEPEEVEQHAPFSASLRITNTTSATIRVVTAQGCLAVPNVLRDGERIPFEGSAWGCTAAIVTHTFPPGETRSLIWDMRAELYAALPGDVDGVPAPKGTYRVQAEFDTMVEGAARKPAVETTLRVR